MLKNPYKVILEWSENLFPHMGGKVFQILAFQPTSLILPKIPYMEITVRSNINALFLSIPGSAKSSICTLFEKLTYSPFSFKSATARGMESNLEDMQDVSIIIDDFAQQASNKNFVKVLEGISGVEAKVSRVTARGSPDYSINAITTIMSIPKDIQTRAVAGGLLSRHMVKAIKLTDEQKEEIAEHIAENIGKFTKSNIFEKIYHHYKELLKIQQGKHKKIIRIGGYDMQKKPCLALQKVHKEKFRSFKKEIRDSGVWARELQDGYRIMLASAFLDVSNRVLVPAWQCKHCRLVNDKNVKKCKKCGETEFEECNKLTPNGFDLEVAKVLMLQNMHMKETILKTEQIKKTAIANNIITQSDGDKWTLATMQELSSLGREWDAQGKG